MDELSVHFTKEGVPKNVHKRISMQAHIHASAYHMSQLRLCGACEIVATARLLQPLAQICLARNIIVCGSARNIIVCMCSYVWVFESMSVCVPHAIFWCAAPRAIKLVARYTLAFILLTLSRTQ